MDIVVPSSTYLPSNSVGHDERYATTTTAPPQGDPPKVVSIEEGQAKDNRECVGFMSHGVTNLSAHAVYLSAVFLEHPENSVVTTEGGFDVIRNDNTNGA